MASSRGLKGSTTTACLRLKGTRDITSVWKDEHQPLLRNQSLGGAALYEALEGGTAVGQPAAPLFPYYALYDFVGSNWRSLWDRILIQWKQSVPDLEYSITMYEPVFASDDAELVGEHYDLMFFFENVVDLSAPNPQLAGLTASFNKWYNEVHVPKEIPMGLTRARRFRATDEAWRYLALYELESLDCLYSAQNLTVRGLGPYRHRSGKIERCIGRKVGGYADVNPDRVLL